MKKVVSCTVYKSEKSEFDLEFKNYLELLTELYNNIPEEERDHARILISPYSYYGDTGVEVSVNITRLETDDEEHQRELLELRERLRKENEEKYLLKRLKKKYENN